MRFELPTQNLYFILIRLYNLNMWFTLTGIADILHFDSSPILLCLTNFSQRTRRVGKLRTVNNVLARTDITFQEYPHSRFPGEFMRLYRLQHYDRTITTWLSQSMWRETFSLSDSEALMLDITEHFLTKIQCKSISSPTIDHFY